MVWILGMLACVGGGVDSAAPDSADPADSGVGDSGTAAERPWVVDAAWLATAGDVQLVDVRSPEEFAAGHAVGALSLPWTDLRAEVEGVEGQVVDAATAQAVARAAGLRAGVPVVAYDGRNGRDAGRLVWSLAWFDAGGAVLDGGWGGWTGPTGAGASEATPGDWTAGGPVQAVRVDAAQILAEAEAGGWKLVDVRTPEEYAAGHIPGAVNVDWTRNVVQDGERAGFLLPEDELRALYPGLSADDTVVVYCHTGARAGLSWVVLAQLGFADVRLYDGSWSEWSTWPDAPVATGSAP